MAQPKGGVQCIFANSSMLCDKIVNIQGWLRFFSAVGTPVATFASGHRVAHARDLAKLDIGAANIGKVDSIDPNIPARQGLASFWKFIERLGPMLWMYLQIIGSKDPFDGNHHFRRSPGYPRHTWPTDDHMWMQFSHEFVTFVRGRHV